MRNLFIENPVEFLKTKALVEVKMAHGLTEDEAVEETIRQRYGESLSMGYIEDCYMASVKLAKEYPSFKRYTREVTAKLQKEITEAA